MTIARAQRPMHLLGESTEIVKNDENGCLTQVKIIKQFPNYQVARQVSDIRWILL